VETFLPCREATTEKMDGGDGAMAEFIGDGELGRRSGRQGHELQEATKTKTWCKGGSLSVGCSTREKNERERGGPSPATSFSSGGGKQRRRRWWVLVLGRGRESVRDRKGRNEGDARVLYG
jgi:hypothetical protein